MRGVIQTADRVKRLTEKVTESKVDESKFEQQEEKNLYQTSLDVAERLQGALRSADFGRALKELSKLTDPVELYFEKVLVMHKDPAIRDNRLAFLFQLRKDTIIQNLF